MNKFSLSLLTIGCTGSPIFIQHAPEDTCGKYPFDTSAICTNSGLPLKGNHRSTLTVRATSVLVAQYLSPCTRPVMAIFTLCITYCCSFVCFFTVIPRVQSGNTTL